MTLIGTAWVTCLFLNQSQKMRKQGPSDWPGPGMGSIPKTGVRGLAGQPTPAPSDGFSIGNSDPASRRNGIPLRGSAQATRVHPNGWGSEQSGPPAASPRGLDSGYRGRGVCTLLAFEVTLPEIPNLVPREGGSVHSQAERTTYRSAEVQLERALMSRS